MKSKIFLIAIVSSSYAFALSNDELKQKSNECMSKKFPEACMPAGYHFEELKNNSEALRFYDLGCELKDKDACNSANDLRNRMCFVQTVTSECGKAPVDEKFKFIESFNSAAFDYKSAMKRMYKFSENKDFRTVLQKQSEKAETPFICSAIKMVASDKEFPGKRSFRQDFGSQWMVKNPNGSLTCISKLDLNQLKHVEPALTANPFEDWAKDSKFAMCQDDNCRKNVIEFYKQQKQRIKDSEGSPEIKKETIQFYLAALNKEIELTKKDIGKD